MPYPHSPFSDGFNTTILCETSSGVNVGQVQDLNLDLWLRWLCEAPAVSSYRVNTLSCTVEKVLEMVNDELTRISTARCLTPPKAYIHPTLEEVIIVEHYDTNNLDMSRKQHEVIVDIHCGAAVLRGSHIFAPGVIGMTSGVKLNDEVNIYADVSKKCKRGSKKVYDTENKIFLGNGIVKMQRHQLFGSSLEHPDGISEPVGIAVELVNSISGCPPIGENFLANRSILQNIPSIICTYVLNPQSGDVVIDMCAAPGNKTSHIGEKMENKGILVAIDKTPTKIKWLQGTCLNHHIKAYIFQADSTKICNEIAEIKEISAGPPFRIETFDKVLLDAPCSALGKRPQLHNFNSEKEIKSFVPLQRKLFHNAVQLVKVGGTLVYSTCTITLAENEGLVAWALKTFDCIRLEKANPYLGGHGWNVEGLSPENLQCVQRFGPQDCVDSVGFFIAKFRKIKPFL